MSKQSPVSRRARTRSAISTNRGNNDWSHPGGACGQRCNGYGVQYVCSTPPPPPPSIPCCPILHAVTGEDCEGTHAKDVRLVKRFAAKVGTSVGHKQYYYSHGISRRCFPSFFSHFYPIFIPFFPPFSPFSPNFCSFFTPRFVCRIDQIVKFHMGVWCLVSPSHHRG